MYNPFSTRLEPTIHPLSAHGFPFGSTLKDASMDVESVKSSSTSHSVPPLALYLSYAQHMTKHSARSSCTTAAFSHDKITKKMNYKAILRFLWLPQLMWSEPAGLLFRFGSGNDSLEIQSPATTANTSRCDFSQTAQLVCVTKVMKYTVFTSFISLTVM